jgi:hypothetical protein
LDKERKLAEGSGMKEPQKLDTQRDEITDILVRKCKAEFENGMPVFYGGNHIRKRCEEAAEQILALIDDEFGPVIGWVNVFKTGGDQFLYGNIWPYKETAEKQAHNTPNMSTVPIRLPKKVESTDCFGCAGESDCDGKFCDEQVEKAKRPYPATTGQMLWDDACNQVEPDKSRQHYEDLIGMADPSRNDPRGEAARWAIANLKPESVPRKRIVMRIEFEGPIPSGKMLLYTPNHSVEILASTVEEPE